MDERPDAGPMDEERVEELTGEVVPVRRTVITPRAAAAGAVVVRQAATVAAGSLVAAGATVVAARLMGDARRGRRMRRRAKERGALPVVASRSFLVDVHLLDTSR